MVVAENFYKTKSLISGIDKKEIAEWLLVDGFFPEQNILPPCFFVRDFVLTERIKITDLNRSSRKSSLIKIKYPKSSLTDRIFSIQDPVFYHDIVFYLTKHWSQVLNLLFNKNHKIYSYSFPIPINRSVGNPVIQNGEIKFPLRSGRLIYQWITMAEKDLVCEAYKYDYIVRSDITNFYNSIYTHSIPWALHGVDASRTDQNLRKLFGNKIDKLMHYSNDLRTNGIGIGSALNDLIAEIILSRIDLNIAKKLKSINFVGTRFKDDYRFLCNSKLDADLILKTLADELSTFNLLINENKTKVLELPNGLYRDHDREYQQHSLKKFKVVTFKTFELTLLTTLDIHKKYGGTSIIEKFLHELIDWNYNLKIKFSSDKDVRLKEIKKLFSLLILLKRESEKILCYTLSIIELIYIKYGDELSLKPVIKELIISEIKKANQNKSIFQLTRYIFFSKYMKLGITENWLLENIDEDLIQNSLLKSCIKSRQLFFNNDGVQLFRKPSECNDMILAKRLDVFHRIDDE